jgi:alkylhydroperoxidase family enzyme
MGLAVSEGTGCKYCAQSHVFLGTWLAKLDTAELELNRRGGSSDPKRAAAVRFVKAIADTRGKVSDEDLADVCAAGFTDADIVSIAGLTAQFLFTNFMSNISQVELDFPAVAPAQA